jgi:uncharacterized protein (TIGR00730 family)
MQSTQDIKDSPLADAWAELQAYAATGEPLEPNAYRLAFADPEFLLRREARGIRFQLEMLKPDLDQTAAGVEHTVVVFGSARFPSMESAQAEMALAKDSQDLQALKKAEQALRGAGYYEQARAFARHVSEACQAVPPSERLYICTGGGPGIMEAANRGAHDVGAPSVALNIALPHEQAANPYVTPHLSFKFHYFALRKMHFMMRAKALLAFPGGFGTLDELFEILTLVQTRKARPVPILLFGSDYWTRLVNFQALVDEGTIAPEDLKLFHYVNDAQQAWAVIREFYQLGGTPPCAAST